MCDPDTPNRAEYWNPASLTYRFLVEAKRLWEMEANIAHISTIQAGMILNGISNLSGLDELGHVYRTHCITLADRMNLYDGPVTGKSERSRQCQIYTAWALFCWDAYVPMFYVYCSSDIRSLLAFSLQQAPLVPRPPYDPVPSSRESPEWYAQIWLRYPEHSVPINANFGVFFEYRARFRIIMAQYCNAAYGKQRDAALSIIDAHLYRLQMLEWFESLPDSLRPENIVLPPQLQLQ